LRFRQERKRFSRRRTEALETCLCESRFARSRRALCRWLGTGSVADTDPDTYSDGDANCDPDANTYTNTYADTKSTATNTTSNTKCTATNTTSNPYTLLKSHI
jgi:hypothetical protein